MVLGLKEFETRGWSTNFRGRFAVHAAQTTKGIDALVKAGLYERVNRLLEEAGVSDWPVGCLVGTAELVNVIPSETAVTRINEREFILGDYGPGRFAWELKAPQRFEEPIPWKGRQGWFTVDLGELETPDPQSDLFA